MSRNNMTEIVPYLFLERIIVPDGDDKYILHIAIRYPENQHIVEETPFLTSNLTTDSSEFHIFTFNFRLNDGDVDNSLLDPLFVNVFTRKIDLAEALSEISQPLRTEIKAIRTGGNLLVFLKDRFVVKLIQSSNEDPTVDIIRSFSVATDFGDKLVNRSGEDDGGDGRNPGHPFL